MPIYETVFYVFSAVLVASAIMVIFVRNPVFAALSLVLAFFSAAALWMLLEVEFLAIVLILVYVGAVLVLFVITSYSIHYTKLYDAFGVTEAVFLLMVNVAPSLVMV